MQRNQKLSIIITCTFIKNIDFKGSFSGLKLSTDELMLLNCDVGEDS